MKLTLPPPGVEAILLTLVLAAALYDVRYRRIPNWLTAAGVLVGLVMNAFLGDWRVPNPANSQIWPGLRFALVGMGIAFAVNFALYALHARGAGDVKLMAAIGAMVGFEDWLGIFVVSALMGGLIALILVVIKKRAMTTFWNVGFILNEMKSGRAAYVKREELDVKSDRALRMPAGAVIAVGTLFFLAASARFTP
jgi:prepilin peptidase CpaA